MPFTAYTKDDLVLQTRNALHYHRKECGAIINEMIENEYISNMLDAYHIEKTDAVVKLISAVLADARSRLRNTGTEIEKEIYVLDEDEESDMG